MLVVWLSILEGVQLACTIFERTNALQETHILQKYNAEKGEED
jgi:hypothetical protein